MPQDFESITVDGRRVPVYDKQGNEAGHGYIYFLRNDGHDQPFGYIEDIEVKQGYRQQGYGRQLIADLEHMAAEAGCYKIVLTSRDPDDDTDQDKIDLHAWYQRLGYQIHGRSFRKDLPHPSTGGA